VSRSFHLVSLGCPKNLVDSEVIYGLLEKHGWQGLDKPDEASFLLINTCGFIQPAVEESIEEILQLSRFKTDAPNKKLVVVGCLVQRYRKSLADELPEVDLFVGTEGVPQIPALLDNLLSGTAGPQLVRPDLFLMDAALPRRLSTPFFRAWLKITEGCDNHCSYCMIPFIRGRLRSRRMDDLVLEAQQLEAEGVRELSLVAQDLTAYGLDLDGRRNLSGLLRRLLAETSVSWIRLLYLYPSTIEDELLELVAANPRIVPYLDIPLQHVSTPILRAMNRRYRTEDIQALLARVRTMLPDAALRTTFLVGFPGETQRDVDQLADFLDEAALDHVGVFAYADEEGSSSAKLPDKIEEGVKEERLQRILAIQSEISGKKLQRFIGTTQQVLVEGLSKETDLLLEGRTKYQAPDIDGCVLINEGETRPGEIVDVEITEAQIYDLVGRIAGSG
jgi:ribosomal protein S12 methylthiotransferase